MDYYSKPASISKMGTELFKTFKKKVCKIVLHLITKLTSDRVTYLPDFCEAPRSLNNVKL